MHRVRLTFVALVALASLALGVASALSETHATKRGSTIRTAATPLGRILVDGKGKTLYLFEKDRGGRSTCFGACASYWPPVLTKGKPVAGRGVKASLLGVTRRPDGTTQVTYARHPLYGFVQDARPGQTTGQDIDQFGAPWYVLSPAGTKIDQGTE